MQVAFAVGFIQLDVFHVSGQPLAERDVESFVTVQETFADDVSFQKRPNPWDTAFIGDARSLPRFCSANSVE